MALGDDDLPGILEELTSLGTGAVVTLGGASTHGVRRRFTQEMLRDSDAPELLSRLVVVTIKSGSLPALSSGSAITVDGTAYKVKRYMEEEHGTLTRIDCVRVA